jgi:hypothetical protein
MSTPSVTRFLAILAIAIPLRASFTIAAPPASGPAPKPQQPADAKASLERVLPDVNFVGIPASDAFDFLREITAVKIDVDWPALEKAGAPRNTPLTLKAKNEKLSVVLDRLLAGLHAKQPLGYEPNGDAIHISTKSELAKKKK